MKWHFYRVFTTPKVCLSVFPDFKWIVLSVHKNRGFGSFFTVYQLYQLMLQDTKGMSFFDLGRSWKECQFFFNADLLSAIMCTGVETFNANSGTVYLRIGDTPAAYRTTMTAKLTQVDTGRPFVNCTVFYFLHVAPVHSSRPTVMKLRHKEWRRKQTEILNKGSWEIVICKAIRIRNRRHIG